MKGNFLQLKKFLESHYPELNADNINGMINPPTAFGEMVASLIGFIWMAGIALLIGGKQIFAALNMAEPSWYQYMRENNVTVFVGLFLLNNIGGAMMQTGAFEIFLDGELIYSKLETGRMPNGQDVVEALSKHGL